MLRTAFERTMQDPQLREDAQKMKFALDPVRGEVLERAVREAYSASPEVVTRAKHLIAPN